MVNLTARDGAGNTIIEQHPTMELACMAADSHIKDGFHDIDMREA